MKAPVFVYYQLDNFYQNHRRYVKSKDYKQLMGETVALDSLGLCDPIKTNQDLANVGIKNNINGKPLDPLAAAIPCGLIAKSIFTDSYKITNQATSASVNVYQKDIAWSSDVKYKFLNQAEPVNAAGGKTTYEEIQKRLCKHYLIKFVRTLHRLDENRWSPQFQKVVGQVERVHWL
jgi:hypothetical protein